MEINKKKLKELILSLKLSKEEIIEAIIEFKKEVENGAIGFLCVTKFWKDNEYPRIIFKDPYSNPFKFSENEMREAEMKSKVMRNSIVFGSNSAAAMSLCIAHLNLFDELIEAIEKV